MKKLFYIFIISLTLVNGVFATTLKDKLISVTRDGAPAPTDAIDCTTANSAKFKCLVDTVNKGTGLAKSIIFVVFVVIIFGMILYISWLFISARGRPDQFKQAWMTLVYLIIGIFIVFLSYAVVNLVASINLGS